MKVDNSFINPKLSYSNLDRFIIRNSIFKALTSCMGLFEGELLDIGCGKMPYKNYILDHTKVTKYVGLDIEAAKVYDANTQPDFIWNGIQMPFENKKFDCAFGTEVLEHCPKPEVILKEINRVLKSGGVFFFTVPFLWNLHEVPSDEYRYTPFSLHRHLKASGFENIAIYASGGWHASFAQMLGLWVVRGISNKPLRKLLKIICKPIISFLMKKDSIPEKFSEGQMSPSFYGIAYKSNCEK